jgi:hypothetical protein
VLSWDGRHIDFVRGTVNFEAFGFQEHFGEPYRPELAGDPATFFPNGGAFAVTRDAYDRAGGFDDAYFAYYDDVDLGWRLRLLGCEIAVAHDAVVYHRHGATSRRFPDERKRFLMERNAIWTAVKCYEDETLARTLGPILLLAIRRIVDRTSVARGSGFARSLAPFSRVCRRWPGSLRAVAAHDVYNTSDQAHASEAPLEEAARRHDTVFTPDTIHVPNAARPRDAAGVDGGPGRQHSVVHRGDRGGDHAPWRRPRPTRRSSPRRRTTGAAATSART